MVASVTPMATDLVVRPLFPAAMVTHSVTHKLGRSHAVLMGGQNQTSHCHVNVRVLKEYCIDIIILALLSS